MCLDYEGKSSFNISSSISQNTWILDSKTTDHMISFPNDFTLYSKVLGKQLLTIANGEHVSIVGIDNIQLAYRERSLPKHTLDFLGRQAKSKVIILYSKHSFDGKLNLLVYVDDMIIVGDDETERLTLKERVATHFEMKNLEKLNFLFQKGHIYLPKKICIDLKLTKKFGCKTTKVLIEQNHKIGSEEGSLVKKS
ncbi:hypothetical protein CR513_00996, partial [Mucuna pruriens]